MPLLLRRWGRRRLLRVERLKRRRGHRQQRLQGWRLHYLLRQHLTDWLHLLLLLRLLLLRQ